MNGPDRGDNRRIYAKCRGPMVDLARKVKYDLVGCENYVNLVPTRSTCM